MSEIRPFHLVSAFVLLVLLTGAAPVGAELQNHGPSGEYFHDTATGLYWFDSSHFNNQVHVTLDLLADHSTVWSWATSAEVDALLSQTAEAGSSLEDVMGLRLSTIGTGGPRWVGYYFDSGIDGWIVQSDDTPDFVTVTATGAQGNAAAFGAGAWFVAAVDPMTSTIVLENDGIYFHDLSTDLYWYDPSEFFGFTRSDVEGWLVSNTGWRWATEADVFGMLGMRSVSGAPLDEIIGMESSYIANGGPRWVGYFDQDGIVNGLILQSDIGGDFNILNTGSTQANAGAFNPGAWLVSDIDPTTTRDASWGEVKRDYE